MRGHAGRLISLGHAHAHTPHATVREGVKSISLYNRLNELAL